MTTLPASGDEWRSLADASQLLSDCEMVTLVRLVMQKRALWSLENRSGQLMELEYEGHRMRFEPERVPSLAELERSLASYEARCAQAEPGRITSGPNAPRLVLKPSYRR